MRHFVGDTETTGLGGPPNAMACEIALVEIDEDLNIIGEWESLINPGIPIQPGAMKIHGITDADVSRPEVPTIEQAVVEIFGEILPDISMTCHNARFDLQFFGPHLSIKAHLCTLELARKVLPGAPNHQLPTLKRHLNLSLQKQHEAMGDILTVVDLLRHLVPLTNRSFLQLLGAAARPSMLYIMPYGKYKGMSIQDIDVDYRNWLLQQSIGADMRYTLETLAKAYI